jgi:hypothetical protein
MGKRRDTPVRGSRIANRNNGDWLTPGLMLAVGAVVTITVIILGSIFLFSGDGASKDTKQTPAASKQTPFKVLDPKAGNLRVGDTEVRQLAGRCPAKDVCEYSSPDSTPVIKVAKGTESLPLAAKATSPYSVSVSALDDSVDTSKVRVAAVDERLLLTKIPAGKYRISLKAGQAAWQFDLEMLPK